MSTREENGILKVVITTPAVFPGPNRADFQQLQVPQTFCLTEPVTWVFQVSDGEAFTALEQKRTPSALVDIYASGAVSASTTEICWQAFVQEIARRIRDAYPKGISVFVAERHCSYREVSE